jgi:SAM-dependent methyltransferase
MELDHHWENVFSAKSPEEMSWYEPHLATSLEWILEAAPSSSSSIIDVGCGTSTLVHDLYAQGFRSMTMLDISPRAIAQSQERLGTVAREIGWMIGDVTRCSLPNTAFDIWHDRAVFHFLTEQEERDSYVKQVASALKPSGQIVIATFAINGPRSCSGLPVSRYDRPSIEQQFGRAFRLMKSATVTHQTPTGVNQEFLYCRMARR